MGLAIGQKKIDLLPNLRLIVSIKAIMAYVPYYTYDFDWAKKLKPKAMADRILRTKGALRHQLVNHNYSLVADTILLDNKSSSEMLNTRCVEAQGIGV